MADELRERVRADLPVSVLKLMDDIETYARKPIAVRLNPYPVSSTDPNPEGPAAAVSKDEAVIYLRNLEANDPQGILHELLHIERYWVQSVPQVEPLSNDRNQWAITSSIENSLEHLVIVPREADYGFDLFLHWNKVARENWGRYPWPEIDDPFARKKNSLLGSLGLELVNDQAVLSEARKCLRAEGLEENAIQFSKRIRELIRRKPQAVSCTFRFLKIPRHEAILTYRNGRSDKQTQKPLPII
jgi:hypothetical protein